MIKECNKRGNPQTVATEVEKRVEFKLVTRHGRQITDKTGRETQGEAGVNSLTQEDSREDTQTIKRITV